MQKIKKKIKTEEVEIEDFTSLDVPTGTNHSSDSESDIPLQQRIS
jgi:mannose-6-phosphate isomerase-like protein (cupin superfamily)